MSKLFKLKKWLTVDEAAKHLSIVFEEEIKEADILRLGLDGELQLSVYFINPPKGQCDKAVSREETGRSDEPVIVVDGDEPVIVVVDGVWDLPLIGNERLDIEHKYQNLTGGPSVIPQMGDGTVVKRDGMLCLLLEEHPRHKDWRRSVDRLPDDAVIVVRTDALREFENKYGDDPLPILHTNVSSKLSTLNEASNKFWSYPDRDDRGTHTDNVVVVEWLEKQGFSRSLAEKGATIIRPDWVPVGRKPEE